MECEFLNWKPIKIDFEDDGLPVILKALSQTVTKVGIKWYSETTYDFHTYKFEKIQIYS